MHISPELEWVFISNKRMKHGKFFDLYQLGDKLQSVKEKQPHLQDISVTRDQNKSPSSYREGFVPNFIPVHLFVSAKLNEPPESTPR